MKDKTPSSKHKRIHKHTLMYLYILYIYIMVVHEDEHIKMILKRNYVLSFFFFFLWNYD